MMEHRKTPEDVVWREFHEAVLESLEVTQERQGLQDIRETLAAWYGVPLESVTLNWDGNELSGQIALRNLEYTSVILNDKAGGEP